MAIQPIDPLEVLSDVQLAARLCGVSVETLRKWRKSGKGPPYLRAGARTVRYRTVDVEAWILTRRVSPGEPTTAESAVTNPAPAAVQNMWSVAPHLRGMRGSR